MEHIRALVIDHEAVGPLLGDAFLPKPGPDVVISVELNREKPRTS